MDVSDDEWEEGVVTKEEEEEDRDRRLYDRMNEVEEPLRREDIHMVQLTRRQAMKMYLTPWFEDYVKGMFYMQQQQ
jgi:RNA polymerase-associated protein RTF1